MTVDMQAAARGFVAFLLLLAAATAQRNDPWKGVDSHDVPHCSLRGGKNSARCGCLGMVSEVQSTRGERCWQQAGFPLPDDPKMRAEIIELMRIGAPSPEIMACLEKVPDHCEVVARGAYYWAYRGKNTCRTTCKPERCGCADSACKPHGQGPY
jgi:hypothetical protein